MATFVLNTFPSRPKQSQEVDLGGQEYRLDFTYRERINGWYVDIFRVDTGEPVLYGRRISIIEDAIEITLDIPGRLVGAGTEYTDDSTFGDGVWVFYLEE